MYSALLVYLTSFFLHEGAYKCPVQYDASRLTPTLTGFFLAQVKPEVSNSKAYRAPTRKVCLNQNETTK